MCTTKVAEKGHSAFPSRPLPLPPPHSSHKPSKTVKTWPAGSPRRTHMRAWRSISCCCTRGDPHVEKREREHCGLRRLKRHTWDSLQACRRHAHGSCGNKVPATPLTARTRGLRWSVAVRWRFAALLHPRPLRSAQPTPYACSLRQHGVQRPLAAQLRALSQEVV